MSLSEMLNKRKLRTEVLAVSMRKKVSFEDQLDFATKRDARMKCFMKELYDSRSNARDTTLQIGDKVLVKQPETDKLSTPEVKSHYGSKL